MALTIYELPFPTFLVATIEKQVTFNYIRGDFVDTYSQCSIKGLNKGKEIYKLKYARLLQQSSILLYPDLIFVEEPANVETIELLFLKQGHENVISWIPPTESSIRLFKIPKKWSKEEYNSYSGDTKILHYNLEFELESYF